MNVLAASVLTLKFAATGVSASLVASPPDSRELWALHEVAIAVERCYVSEWRSSPGWSTGFALWGGRLWLIFTAQDGASPLRPGFLDFGQCRPRVAQVWLTWKYSHPFYGNRWHVQCLDVQIVYRGYTPDPDPGAEERRGE